MMILVLLVQALVQFCLYTFVGISLDACIFGFLVGSILYAVASTK